MTISATNFFPHKYLLLISELWLFFSEWKTSYQTFHLNILTIFLHIWLKIQAIKQRNLNIIGQKAQNYYVIQFFYVTSYHLRYHCM